ncbi:MAG: LPS assembly lipoprotein LptE [Pseudomonadota bacterium]
MSSFDRRSLLLGLAALPACGFEPVHGTSGSARGLYGQILFEAPNDANSFNLRKQLEDRLGRNDAAPYTMAVSLDLKTENLAITSEQSITRLNVIGTARYQIRRTGTPEVLDQGKVSNFTGYSASGSTVATSSARDDAFERLTTSLADQIVSRLYATSSSWQ